MPILNRVLTYRLRHRLRVFSLTGISTFVLVCFPPLVNSQSGSSSLQRCFYPGLCITEQAGVTFEWLENQKSGPGVLVRQIDELPAYLLTAQAISPHQVSEQVLWFDLVQTIKRSRQVDNATLLTQTAVWQSGDNYMEGRIFEWVKGYRTEQVSYFLVRKKSGDYWVVATAPDGALLTHHFDEIQSAVRSIFAN